MRNRSLTGIFYCLAILTLFSAVSCQPEEEKLTNDPSIHLTFSQDTVLFDTIFTTVGSVTKRFKVYNQRNNAISINSIKLGGGNSSAYSIYVNGMKGKSFGEQILFGNDSMLILVEVLIDPISIQTPFVVEDSVIFETTGISQNVKLLAWGQNANFINDSILACNITWDNSLPFVIVNSALVDSGCTLIIEAGTKIYFHNNSALYIAGSLVVSGSPEGKVIFTSDRLDAPYNETPGQWEGVYFLEGSSGNVMNHAVIRNPVYGIWLGTPDDDDTPDLQLSNTVIENTSRTGLIAFTSDLVAYNVLINNSGEYALANFAGGNYSYTHLTIANMGFTFFREFPSAIFTDELELSDGSIISEDAKIEFANSIVWGNISEELFFDFNRGLSTALFNYNLLKTEVDTFAASNLVNINPRFINAELNIYKIDSVSPARDAGLTSFVVFDIDGNPRDAKPDLGAYEYKNQ